MCTDLSAGHPPTVSECISLQWVVAAHLSFSDPIYWTKEEEEEGVPARDRREMESTTLMYKY